MQYGPYLEQFTRNRFSYARKTGEEAFLQPEGGGNANGGDSSSVRYYLERMVAANQPIIDLLLVNCGLHDIKTSPETGTKQVPIDQYEENLNEIVKLSCSKANRVGWIRTTTAVDSIHNKPGMEFLRHAADLDRYNAIADAVVEEAGINSIDLYGFTVSLGPAEEIFCDHVHYIERVRELQGAYIAGFIQSISSK